MKWFLGLVLILGIGWWTWNQKSQKWLDPLVASFNMPKKEEKILGELRKKIDEHYAVYVYRLKDEDGYGINENQIMPAASIMKLPALIAAYEKKDETWVLEGADITSGSGPMQFMRPGTSLTVGRIMNELGKKSDNTAWVMINRRLGYKEMEKLVPANTNYRELTTTALDVTKMWIKIYERPELWPHLEDSIYEDRITLGIPKGTRLIHKVGTDDGVWADSGIILGGKPFILVILNKEIVREEARRTVPEITKMIWEYEMGRVK